MSDPTPNERTGRFFDSIGRLGAALADALRTRLELAATEIEEELLRVGLLLLGGLTALLCFICALATVAVLIIAAAWDSYRLQSIGILAGVFLLFSIVAALLTQRGIKRHPRLFSSTVRELERDRDRLAGGGS